METYNYFVSDLKVSSLYGRDSLQPIAEVNDQLLQLVLLRQRPWLDQISALFARDVAAVSRIAHACPFALFDVRFRDAAAWSSVSRWRPSDCPCPLLPKGDLDLLLNSACHVAWHISRRWSTDAGVLLGASAPVTDLLRSIDVNVLQRVSIHHPDWLQLRWQSRHAVWAELLALASTQHPRDEDALRLRAMEHFFGELLG